MTPNPILINTLPKSGSIYIWNALANGLGRDRRPLPSGGFLTQKHFNREQIAEFAQTDQVTQDHAPASFYNCRVLDNFLDRMVLHVRDPRQAILSWTHYMDELKERLPIELTYIPLPSGYFTYSLEARIEVMLNLYWGDFVTWLAGWDIVLTSGMRRCRILVTRHEDMQDTAGFFGRILEFYGIPPASFTLPNRTAVTGEQHFRSGLTDEWRAVFTPAQIRRVTESMPDSLFATFGWER